MSHHLVAMQNVHYSYPDGTRALYDINFEITHGESVALVGGNGAGKSTLLQHLVGYLWPSRGQVRIGDFPLTKQTLQDVRRCIGMVFQDPNDQLFMPTVLEDVAFGPLNLGLPRAEVMQRVDSALMRVGALHLKDRPAQHLSGGEKRAVSIASVLVMSPDILVLDEPTTGLDPVGRRLLIDWLAKYEHTKVIASHDLDLVLDLCQRTIVLGNGEIIADGPTHEIFQDEKLLKRSRLEKPLRLQACPICQGSL